ncbi:MAG: thioredoxin family protein [Bacillota bacterium]|jgi:thioredoxin 1
MVHEFTEANFQANVLNNGKPVLVKFWSQGCYPCKMMTPIVEQFAEKYQGKIVTGSVNVSSNMSLAMKYNISGVPTTILFSSGKPAAKVVGYVDLEDLEDSFADFLV